MLASLLPSTTSFIASPSNDFLAVPIETYCSCGLTPGGERGYGRRHGGYPQCDQCLLNSLPYCDEKTLEVDRVTRA
jgi:hypothetical protein